MFNYTSDVYTSSPEVTTENEADSEWDTSKVISLVAGTIMTLVSFIGQCIVFVVVSKDVRLRSPGNIFIVSLALADMLITLVSMPVWTMYSTLGRWPASQFLCDLWNTFDYVLCCVSVYTILFISVDRYFSLRDPLRYQAKRTLGKTMFALAMIWVVMALVFGSYIQLTQIYLGKERDLNDCATYYLTKVPLTFLLCTFGHWSTIGGTLVVYVQIYRIASTAGRVGETGALKTSAHGKKQSEDRENDNKALRTIALLLVTFAICWLPLSIIFVITSIAPELLTPTWMIVGYWMGYVNSMLNPICYAIGNPYFKETLKKLCGRN